MNLLQDLRFGFRMLAARPAVTAAAVLSLALGVGANSAVFSLIDAMMLKGLPVESPGELVIFGPGRSRGVIETDAPEVQLFSHPRFESLRERVGSLSFLAAIGSNDGDVYIRRAGEEAPTAARARLVSGDYFPMLGVKPALGRLLGPEDDVATGGHPVAVLDQTYWRERFGGDEAALGSSIVLNDRAFTIVGVTPSAFFGERLGARPEIYLPLRMQAEAMRQELFLDQPNVSFLHLMGRLKPDVSIHAAEAEAATAWRALLEAEGGERPSEAWLRGMERAALTLRSGKNGYTDLRRLENPLWLLLGVTVLVVLIACANVANLMLARGAARAREMGVRAALGADRKRLFAQVLTESLLLAALAGAAALVAAHWSLDVLIAMARTGADELGPRAGIDRRIFGFTAAAALGTGLLFGVLPARRASRTDVAAAMRGGGRGTVGASGGRLRSALVAGQAALSLLLLFATGLFVESFGKLARADIGIARESLLSVTLDPRGGGLDEAGQADLGRRLIAAVEALPGATSAAMISMPLISGGKRQESLTIRGREAGPNEDAVARFFIVSPGYFETVGTRLLAGRSFGPRDADRTAPAVIVDEELARRFFPDQDPLDQWIQFDDEIGMARVVGVVAAAKLNNAREEPQPTIFVSGYAYPSFFNAMAVRAVGDPAAVGGAARRAIAETEPRLPIRDVSTVEERLANQAANDRMLLRLTSGFGMLALLLAAIGLYGVLSYNVAARASEIGVRMAVGADRRDVLRLVLKQGLTPAVGGVALGAAAAPVAASAFRSLLFQTEPWNAATLAASSAALLAAALLAALTPALRAARLDPANVLREE